MQVQRFVTFQTHFCNEKESGFTTRIDIKKRSEDLTGEIRENKIIQLKACLIGNKTWLRNRAIVINSRSSNLGTQ